MKKTLYSSVAAGALLAVLALMAAHVLLAGAPKTHANQSGFYGRVTTPGTATAPVASTTISYMTTGTGTTTTQVLDAYANGNGTKLDSAALNVQLTGSSSSAVLLISVETSNDNVDWYPVALMSPIGIATSTNAVNLSAPVTYTLTSQATTTVGTAALTTRTPRSFIIPVQERYTRAVFSITGANGGVWAEIVPVRQIHE